MGLQVSASKTALLLHCQYPFGDHDSTGEQLQIEPDEPEEATRYGSAFHEIMEGAPLGVGEKYDEELLTGLADSAARKWDLSKTIAAELVGHVRGSLSVLQKWLGGRNPWDFKFEVSALERETSYAIRIKPGGTAVQVRPIARPTAEGHIYEEAEKKEIPGTVDLMRDADNGTPSLVMDYKSGAGREENFERPAKHAQLRTLGLIPKQPPIVAIFHADRRGLPIVYAEELPRSELHVHARRLDRAMKRRNSGYLRPGKWCKRCPARSICPTQTAELLAGAASLVNGGHDTLVRTAKSSALVTKEDIGRLHQFFAEFERLKEQARPLMKTKVKELLEANEIVVRPDGKVLVITKRSEERLSKGRIVEALGAAEAERLFTKLRRVGALEAIESERLEAKFPD